MATKDDRDNEARTVAAEREWHLGHTRHDAVTTELEWSVMRFCEAFIRNCMQVAHVSGLGDLSFPELFLLHVIGLQDRPATVALLARQMNTDSISNLQYSLRKLIGYKLVTKIKQGNSKVYTYDVTKKGDRLVDLYARVRQMVLTEQTTSIENVDGKMLEAAKLLSMLTGIYDEAARKCATYNLVPLNNDPAES